ncbi:adenosylcobinamide-GDP ribazoletransferase [Acidisoma sp.]|uniref:adenosylcobinamide-GDP ribazoletransferase n=1 Tax=Acidisoma sp. TaxID=1872115 RepID=UPI003AFF8E64
MPTGADLVAAFGLLTRLPLPREATASSSGASVWAWPVVGLVIGLIGAAAYALAWRAGLSALLAALLAVTATVVATGGFHEDGLADTTDGIGGGATPEKRLMIMKDSRIGSFGALALIASVGLRVGALAQLAEPRLVAAALIVAAVLGRSAMPGVVLLSPPARTGGLGAALGALDRRRLIIGGVIALLACLLLERPHVMLEALLVTLMAAAAMAGVGVRSLGGYTGDTLGATEQLVECAVLMVLAAAVR